MNKQSSSSDNHPVRAAVILRTAAIVLGASSVITYATVLLIMTKLSDLTVALQLLAAAPYGIALSIAAAGSAQYVHNRHLTKEDAATNRRKYKIANALHAFTWTALALLSIPVTTIGVVS